MNKDNGDMSADSYRLYLEDVNILKELNVCVFLLLLCSLHKDHKRLNITWTGLHNPKLNLCLN